MSESRLFSQGMFSGRVNVLYFFREIRVYSVWSWSRMNEHLSTALPRPAAWWRYLLCNMGREMVFRERSFGSLNSDSVLWYDISLILLLSVFVPSSVLGRPEVLAVLDFNSGNEWKYFRLPIASVLALFFLWISYNISSLWSMSSNSSNRFAFLYGVSCGIFSLCNWFPPPAKETV